MNYQGKEVIDDGVNANIFFGLRSISMYIACGDLKGAYEFTQDLFYDNLFNSDYFYSNLRDGDFYSNICEYSFKPIFSGRKFRALVSHGDYIYSKECHNVTLQYLKYFGKKNDNMYAATVLTRGLDSKSYFHSFILDSTTDMVYDFANNIIMPRNKYYQLIVMDELNVINYKDYVSRIKEYSDLDKDGLADLLFLGLVELKNKEKINLY